VVVRRKRVPLKAPVTINNYLLFCVGATVCFDPYRPSSGRLFRKQYVYNKRCPRCTYVKLKYSTGNESIANVYKMEIYYRYVTFVNNFMSG